MAKEYSATFLLVKQKVRINKTELYLMERSFLLLEINRKKGIITCNR